MAQVFQAQLMSLVGEGVFDAFPDLRVVLRRVRLRLAAGAPVAVRQDWQGLRREMPWVRPAAVGVLREHVR